MILPEFRYTAPKTMDEAVTLLKEYGTGAKIMAGGTDLINFVKAGAIKPEAIVDIKNLPGMDEISFDSDNGLTIGSLVKLRDIELSEDIKKNYPALSEAVHLIASTQIRSKGTLTGNICNASPSADSVPALFALDARLCITGSEGQREIPIDQFYKGFKKIDLKSDEIVTAVKIPPMSDNTKAAYIAHTVRKAMDLAIVGIGAALTLDENGVCIDARIALGAVAVNCVRSPKAEEVLKGNKITEELAAKAGLMAMEDCKPISDVRASAEYRHDMVRVFTRRAIMKAYERFSEETK